MGRDFEKELSGLDKVYNAAQTVSVQVIIDFLSKFKNKVFWGIGSGGSYSVARVFEYLCARAGLVSKSLTPLELSLYDIQIKRNAAILFTAGGKNADSKNVYQYLSEIEPEGLLSCCMCVESPLKEKQKSNLHNYFFEYKMPVKKDGYLAVESLVSLIVLLGRAFEAVTENGFFHLPLSYTWRKYKIKTELLNDILKKESLIILHGGITTPVAVDLESKFSEASLGNIQIVDFRNFAHGRHYWLSSRENSTAIIALVGKMESELASQTLRLIPESIPILKVDVDDSSIGGMLDVFDFAFEFVFQAGLYRGVNPGCPKIDTFGTKLYHLSYNICSKDHMRNRKKNVLEMAIYRKAEICCREYEERSRQMGKLYHQKLTSSRFKGIVFDYDGTLHDKNGHTGLEDEIFEIINGFLSWGIKIGIATGRGKSVRIELQKVIREKYWDKVVIAYYNGGCIGMLGDEGQPNKKGQNVPDEFNELLNCLESNGILKNVNVDGVIDKNPYQLSIILNDYHEDCYINYIVSLCSRIKGLKVLKSSHSIDIIPASSSKNNIFEYWNNWGYKKEDFLVIGDAGQIGGNDYELLEDNQGLSVDGVSSNPDTCWNFAKPGMRNLEATLYYLKKIKIKNSELVLGRLL